MKPLRGGCQVGKKVTILLMPEQVDLHCEIPPLMTRAREVCLCSNSDHQPVWSGFELAPVWTPPLGSSRPSGLSQPGQAATVVTVPPKRYLAFGALDVQLLTDEEEEEATKERRTSAYDLTMRRRKNSIDESGFGLVAGALYHTSSLEQPSCSGVFEPDRLDCSHSHTRRGRVREGERECLCAQGNPCETVWTGAQCTLWFITRCDSSLALFRLTALGFHACGLSITFLVHHGNLRRQARSRWGRHSQAEADTIDRLLSNPAVPVHSTNADGVPEVGVRSPCPRPSRPYEGSEIDWVRKKVLGWVSPKLS
jgi:hypothetical protein